MGDSSRRFSMSTKIGKTEFFSDSFASSGLRIVSIVQFEKLMRSAVAPSLM